MSEYGISLPRLNQKSVADEPQGFLPGAAKAVTSTFASFARDQRFFIIEIAVQDFFLRHSHMEVRIP